MLVVFQPPPLSILVFLLSDWREACATSPAHSCARSDQAGASERQKKHQEDIFTFK